MLLQWLLIGLYALSMLVARSRGMCGRQCNDSEAGSPRGGRRQRDHTHANSPRTPAAAPPLQRPLGSDPRQMVLAGIIVTIIQLLAVVRWTPGLGRMLTLTGFVNITSMMVVPGVGLVLLPALAPAFYQRHSGILLAIVRICYFALPNLRDPLDVQYVFQFKLTPCQLDNCTHAVSSTIWLQSQPSPRVLGFISDAFSLMLGLRGVALLLAPLVCPVPLLPHLAMSAFAVQRLRTNAFMCSSPMLQHSVWRRRITWALRIVRHLPLLGPEPSALNRGLAAGPEPLEAVECSIFLTLCQVAVGIVVPTLLLAKLQAPGKTAAAAGAEQRRGRSRQSGGRADANVSRRLSSHSPVKNVSGRCVRLLRSAADEVEAALWHLCQLLTNRAGSLLVTSLAWWLLLSVIWVGVLLLEQPRLLLSPAV